MGRALRAAVGGLVYHVLNRANRRQTLFEQAGDYEAFERVLAEAQEQYPVPLLAYCVMPNHWHLVLAPQQDRHLSRFVGWLTLPDARFQTQGSRRSTSQFLTVTLEVCEQVSMPLPPSSRARGVCKLPAELSVT